MFTFLSTIFFFNLQQERSFQKLCKISKAFLLIPRSLVRFWKRMRLTMTGAVLCMYVPAGRTKQNKNSLHIAIAHIFHLIDINKN